MHHFNVVHQNSMCDTIVFWVNFYFFKTIVNSIVLIFKNCSYEETQFYSQHHDYFDKRFYANDKHTMELIKNGEKNRFITVFWYLTTVEVGGHTIFPKSFGSSPLNRYSTHIQSFHYLVEMHIVLTREMLFS